MADEKKLTIEGIFQDLDSEVERERSELQAALEEEQRARRAKDDSLATFDRFIRDTVLPVLDRLQAELVTRKCKAYIDRKAHTAPGSADPFAVSVTFRVEGPRDATPEHPGSVSVSFKWNGDTHGVSADTSVGLSEGSSETVDIAKLSPEEVEQIVLRGVQRHLVKGELR